MIKRREFLKTLFLVPVPFLFKIKLTFAQSADEDEQMRDFEWRVPKVYFETVKKELKFEGEIKEEHKDVKGFPILYVFVGTVLLTYLAKAVLALRRDIVYGGVVIDTRGEKIEIETDKSLSGGVIVLVTPDGTDMYEIEEIENPSKLVDILKKAM